MTNALMEQADGAGEGCHGAQRRAAPYRRSPPFAGQRLHLALRATYFLFLLVPTEPRKWAADFRVPRQARSLPPHAANRAAIY